MPVKGYKRKTEEYIPTRAEIRAACDAIIADRLKYGHQGPPVHPGHKCRACGDKMLQGGICPNRNCERRRERRA